MINSSLIFSREKEASIHFENNQHNFGTVNEADNMLEHDFIFTNKVQYPMIVTNVKAGGVISVLRVSGELIVE